MRWLVTERLAVILPTALALAVLAAPVAPGPVSTVPFVVAVVLIALCVTACCWVVRRPTPAPATLPTAGIDVERGPVRQCDPDSAGHVRPRAPGSTR